ncbi:MAG: c-type cytochrome [Bacteroidia bacterium]|nr:c-type cytochrome [Bacteroidia bacterium]
MSALVQDTLTDNFWKAPDTSLIAGEKNAEQILYGKQLIANTSFYYGPKGTLQHSSNGMNCQNCHLEAGTKPFGNNYSAVAATYPKFRERSGTIESIQKRINDCFQRSLNGSSIDTTGKEMRAIVAYINWLGKGLAKGTKPAGAGLKDLEFLDRAASPDSGAKVYGLKCKTCHGANGEGQLGDGTNQFKYPPLWGHNSYNLGAGLYRLSRFAAYVKNNMPEGATHQKPQLSNEEAWDVAAYVNTQIHPAKDISKDWPEIKQKPIDHPFGPYSDDFTEKQHKYGPFKPILSARKTNE